MPVLDWPTRAADIRAANEAPFRILEESPDLSFGDGEAGNMLIRGDNLDALKALLPFYAGRVKCVFIDPPYNTGFAFKDYDDSMEHTKWLSMMYPRLRLLHSLLAEDGSIWVTIDDDEGHYLKVLMDEIFGRANFVANIVWQKKFTTSNDAKGIPDSHDHILVFRKSERFERRLLPRTEKANNNYRYDDNDGRGPWAPSPLTAKTFSPAGVFPIVNPQTGASHLPPKGRCWRLNRETRDRFLAENRIFFGKSGRGAPMLKRYLSEVQQGIVPNTWWPFEEAGHNAQSRSEVKRLFEREDIFDTPKPEKLIKRVLQIATEEGDLVLDSFLGSGTTAAVAHKMGRRWIGIEMSDSAEDYCARRLQKVVEGEDGGVSQEVGWKGGGGFRFYSLGPAVRGEDGMQRERAASESTRVES